MDLLLWNRHSDYGNCVDVSEIPSPIGTKTRNHSMRFRSTKLLLIAGFAVALTVAMPQSSDAFFWSCCRPTCCYRPVRCCRPVCCPAPVCSPCAAPACGTSPCGSGGCGISYQAPRTSAIARMRVQPRVVVRPRVVRTFVPLQKRTTHLSKRITSKPTRLAKRTRPVRTKRVAKATNANSGWLPVSSSRTTTVH